MTDTNTNEKKHIAIIGGGITGLSTAWYLQNRAQENGIRLHSTVLEPSDRLGGKIITETIDEPGIGSFIIEGGPDSFLTQKPWALQLARDLDLDTHLLGTNDQQRKTHQDCKDEGHNLVFGQA